VWTERGKRPAGRRAVRARLVAGLCAVVVAGRVVAALALCGDVGGEGTLRASDALAILRLSVAGGYDPAGDLAAGGLPADGLLTSTDALVALRAALNGTLPGCAAATATRVLAVTASDDFSSGGIATIDLGTFAVVEHHRGVAAGDSVVRHQMDRIFVLNRFGANNVQELEPDGLATLRQCSVGLGTNPHDIVMISPSKAYVTLYDRPTLAIVDPGVDPTCAGFVTDHIDLAALADGDGIPEMDQSVLVGNRLFVTLQRLDRARFFRPGGPGRLAVIDTDEDTVIGSVELEITNPFAETKGLIHDLQSGRIYVAGPGTLFTDPADGGIEIVDPVGLVSLGVAMTGAELGGDVSDLVLVGRDRAYALVASTGFRISLVELDLPARRVTATLASSDFFFSDIELNEDGTLCVADRDPFAPGLRCFSVADNREVTPEPVNPGLSPFNFVFVP
jgi:hypothetical protein